MMRKCGVGLGVDLVGLRSAFIFSRVFCPPSERHQQVIFTHNEVVYSIYDNLDEVIPKPDDGLDDGWGVNNW